MPARDLDWHLRTDRHASRASMHPAERVRASALTYEADDIELACPLCVLEWHAGRWVHVIWSSR